MVWKYNGETESVGAIWFLPTLFLGKLWITYISKLRHYYIYLILGALCSIVFTKVTKCVVPFTLQQALTCAPFLLIGSKLKEWNTFGREYNKDFVLAISIAFLPYAPTAAVAMRINSLSAFGYVTATIISIIVIYILKFIEQSTNKVVQLLCNFFTWCGRYSLIILCIHSIEDEFQWFTLSHKYFAIEILIRWTYIIAITWLCASFTITKKIFNVK